MRIELLHVADCPNTGLARTRISEALEQSGLEADVEEILVTDAGVAAEARFAGSPTILVDGDDPFAPGDAAPALACRLFLTDVGLEGAPTVAALVAALHARRPHGEGGTDGGRPDAP